MLSPYEHTWRKPRREEWVQLQGLWILETLAPLQRPRRKTGATTRKAIEVWRPPKAG